MMGSSSRGGEGDPEATARVAMELRRLGLRASDEQVAALAAGYRHAKRQLEDLREWLDQNAPEPAVMFSAAAAFRRSSRHE